jgi:hypothetical protein
MNIFPVAFAETAAQTTQEVDQVAKAAAAGSIVGVTLFTVALCAVVWYVLQAIADWKIFAKAGEAGWKSFIPFYNVFVEYEISWNGLYGLAFIAATIISSWLNTLQNAPSWLGIVSTILAICAAVLHALQSIKLAKSFGKGTGFGILLFLFGPICRMVLGFGSAEYIGPQ